MTGNAGLKMNTSCIAGQDVKIAINGMDTAVHLTRNSGRNIIEIVSISKDFSKGVISSMKFNAKKFTTNADSVSRKALPESHRQVLDGKEVVNEQIEYEADGTEWYLYPVLPEWCDK